MVSVSVQVVKPSPPKLLAFAHSTWTLSRLSTWGYREALKESRQDPEAGAVAGESCRRNAALEPGLKAARTGTTWRAESDPAEPGDIGGAATAWSM